MLHFGRLSMIIQNGMLSLGDFFYFYWKLDGI